jgi:hypothetical protein
VTCRLRHFRNPGVSGHYNFSAALLPLTPFQNSASLWFHTADQFACSSAHCRAAGLLQIMEERQNPLSQCRIADRKIEQGLHGIGFHDPALVIEIAWHDHFNPAPFVAIEVKPWQHLGKMPAHFQLGGTSRKY